MTPIFTSFLRAVETVTWQTYLKKDVSSEPIYDKSYAEKLDIRIVKAYGAQLVCTLEYLQTLEIMHRDLKPQNLLLDDKMNIKMVSLLVIFIQLSFLQD